MKKSVLIIAKNEFFRTYKNLLIDGIDVELCAFNDAHGIIDEIRAEVVLVDSDSNTGPGLELLKKLKASHPRIPIIFITSRSSEDAVITAFRSGAREYFKLPLNMFELRATIESLLKLKESSTEDRLPLCLDGINELSSVIPSSTPPNMLRAVFRIMDNLSAKLSLDDLAKEALMSKYHFCRSFNKHFGMSPMKFVTCMRIRKSLELLKKRNMTVSMIADEVGYSDPGNFIRHFKKLTGQTPTAYKGFPSKHPSA